MSFGKVCRVCLVKDVRMYYSDALFMDHLSLETCYEVLVGTPITVDIPKYMCYECSELLKKFYKFRKRCLRTQTVLNDMNKSCKKSTKNEVIENIDKEYFHLSSNLALGNVSCINIYENREQNNIEIKEEAHEESYSQKTFNRVEYIGNKVYDNVYLPFNNKILLIEDNEPIIDIEPINDNEICDNIVIEEFDLNGCKLTNAESESETKPADVEQDPVNKRLQRKKSKKIPTTHAQRYRSHFAEQKQDIQKKEHIESYCTITQLTEAEQIEQIRRRQTSTNFLKAVYQCKLCFKGFQNEKAWKLHASKHGASAGKVECPVCKLRYRNVAKMNHHRRFTHATNYTCKSCARVSKTIIQAQYHQDWHNGKEYKCHICSEVSLKWTSYLSHVRIKHPSEFICEVCGYSFVSKLGLAMHRTMMHKSDLQNEESDRVEDEALYCSECDVSFLTAEAHKRHIVTSAKHSIGNTSSVGCRECGEWFASAPGLRAHRRTHAPAAPRAAPVTCRHCEEILSSTREYLAHLRFVHPEEKYPRPKPHLCDICGKGFRCKAVLEYHSRSHSEEKPFKCTQCPKSFINRYNLTVHEMAHSEDRPFLCTLCAKTFKCKGALERHFRIHSGVKPYSCEVCGKSFGQSNSCKLHMRSVHNMQPPSYLSRVRREQRQFINNKNT